MNEDNVEVAMSEGQLASLIYAYRKRYKRVSQKKQIDNLALSVLQYVFDVDGKYGRTDIARILVGKQVLPINISKLGTYGVAKDASMKEVLALIDWLIEENYLAYVEDSELPVLVVTSKGLDVLS